MHRVSVGEGEEFLTINQALQGVSVKTPLHIFVKNGIYNEKLYIDHDCIKITGESAENTIITNGDGAYDIHADGTKNGTFRTYTMWLSGGTVSLESLTVQNTCGDGDIKGQGIALAIDAQDAHVTNVNLYGHQDTLFTGPLPLHERMKGGFKGPSEHKPRINSTQKYINCVIKGDVDFIFGGASALFDNCKLIGNARNKTVNGYFSAPSTPKGGKGYVFLNCSFQCNQPHTYYLARPWRKYAKAAFINCEYNSAIHPDIFNYWESENSKETVLFTTHNCK